MYINKSEWMFILKRRTKLSEFRTAKISNKNIFVAMFLFSNLNDWEQCYATNTKYLYHDLCLFGCSMD